LKEVGLRLNGSMMHERPTTTSVPDLVEHLFRHQAGRMLATLCRAFGLEHLDLAEEVVQEAMLKALRLWPFHGVPENPEAWLLRIARHEAIDRLRRRAVLKRKAGVIEDRLRAEIAHGESAALRADHVDVLNDDQLAMIFACCHPALPPDARVALTLKAVCGLSTSEIARGFLVQEETIAQRLVRAKRRIRDEAIALALPPLDELPKRLDWVLRVVYLTFNEGYAAHQGEDLVRTDLCGEAIRLATLLVTRPETSQPQSHALLALLLLQASRLPARVNKAGDLLRLRDQDRSAWDRSLIGLGMHHLSLAATGDDLTEYHVQAAIASVHAAAPSYEQTDWPYLLELYDELMCITESPMVALNRVVALAMVEGADRALRTLDKIASQPPLADYYLSGATRGELLCQLGRYAEAADSFRAAASLDCSKPERRFLSQRLAMALEMAAPNAVSDKNSSPTLELDREVQRRAR
jgi:RNA polymerase sigma-70 factor (ECF subfamily)